MWRPDLHPLPCRHDVVQSTAAPYSYVVLEDAPSGTVLEVSLCLEVSLIVVDQFPFLWDFVLTGETENDHTGCQQTSASSRTHTACVFADQDKGNIGEHAERVLYFHFSTRSLPIFKPVIIQNPFRPHDLGLGLGSCRPEA